VTISESGRWLAAVKGRAGRAWKTVLVPEPGRGRGDRQTVQACGVCQKTCTTRQGGISATTSRTCSATRAAGVVDGTWARTWTDVEPGDFVISTGGRAVWAGRMPRLQPRGGGAARGTASTPTNDDTEGNALETGTELSRRGALGAFREGEDAGRGPGPVHKRVNPAHPGGPRPACRLRADGGHRGAASNTGGVGPTATAVRGDRPAAAWADGASARRLHGRRAHLHPAVDVDDREAGVWARGFGATHVNQLAEQPKRRAGDPGADRRVGGRKVW